MSKVPQITVLFWGIKVLTTAQGEAVSDFAALRYGPVILGHRDGHLRAGHRPRRHDRGNPALGLSDLGDCFHRAHRGPGHCPLAVWHEPHPGLLFACVVTRPLGASFADYLGVPHRYGGLGLGRGLVGLILTFVIIGLVGYLAVTRKDVAEPAAARPPRGRGQHRQQA